MYTPLLTPPLDPPYEFILDHHRSNSICIHWISDRRKNSIYVGIYVDDICYFSEQENVEKAFTERFLM